MSVRIAGPAMAMVLALVSPMAVRAEGLTIGDPAPPLAVSKWVKGEKIEKLDPGQIYVMEFWATWCGPCRTSIPHLTELQKKNPAVIFIGVAVFENDTDKVEPFVKEMGDKMDYRVAIDATSAGKDEREGKMGKSWMSASEEEGIPTAFIIDKAGKIAWIGHPMTMEEPLAKIVAGEWDLKSAASQRTEAKAENRALMETFGKLRTLLQDREKNGKEIIALIDQSVEKMPSLANQLAPLKLDILLRGPDQDAATALGTDLVDNTFKTNAQGLNAVAWLLIDPDAKREENPRAVKLALRAAERANEITKGENYAVLDTLALATFLAGDVAKAVELQEKAIKLSPEKNPGMTERLERFRKGTDKSK